MESITTVVDKDDLQNNDDKSTVVVTDQKDSIGYSLSESFDYTNGKMDKCQVNLENDEQNGANVLNMDYER